MPISSAAYARSTTLLLLIGLAILLVLVSITLWLTVRTEEYSNEVSRSREVRASLVAARSLLQDAETGQRGFLLTEAESYLLPYESARDQVGNRIAELEVLPGAEPFRAEVARLRLVVTAKLAELAETIALTRSGRRDEALAIVRSDRGKDLMDQARGIVEAVLRANDRRIVTRMNAQDSTITALKWSVILGALMITLVAGGSTFLSFRYTGELRTAREQLAAFNAGLERRVQERTVALGRANEEIQRFAYVVSHDLRSPLVNVLGFVAELDDLRQRLFPADAAGEPPAPADPALAAEFVEALSFIRVSVEKMDGLINAILKLAREGERRLVPERLDLGSLLEKAAADVRHRLGERDGDMVIGPLPTIVSDRLALQQIFGNLIDNAVKYAAPARPLRIRVAGRVTPEDVEVSIADNGIGIAPEHQTRVFELFRRVGRSRESGEGIGLAHVQALMRRLGGRIDLASTPDAGSTFTLHLPRVLELDAGKQARA